MLAELLPDGCVPVLVTVAGFRRLWMKAVAAQGWYYVARIRSRELYCREENDWQPVKNLCALATSSPKETPINIAVSVLLVETNTTFSVA